MFGGSFWHDLIYVVYQRKKFDILKKIKPVSNKSSSHFHMLHIVTVYQT